MMTMMTRRARAPRAPWAPLGALLIALTLTSPLQAQERQTNPNTTPNTSSKTSANSPYQDTVSLYLAKFKPLYQGPFVGLAKKTILTPDKRTITLDQVTKELFKLQAPFEQELRRAPAGALHGSVKVVEVGVELPDAYILTRTLGFYVADPDKLRAASRTFAAQIPKPTGAMTVKDLTPEMMTKFFQAKAALLGSAQGAQASAAGPAAAAAGEHPLRRAAQTSDQALLDATVQGVGPQTVQDTFVFLKQQPTITPQGQIMIPAFRGGAFDISRREPMAQTFARPMPAPVPLPTTQVSGGVIDHRAQLIQGFTYPNHWHWKRRWEFWSGHAQLEAQLNYGFGVRAPVELRLRLEPSVIANTGAQDSASRLTGTLSARTLDGDRAFYERSGMVQTSILDGKEFVLFANFCYGYSFEALWVTWGQRPCSPYGFDLSRDYTPPMSSTWQRLFEYFIPAELTRTVIDLGTVKGSLQVGAALEAKGSLTARLRAALGDAPLLLQEASSSRRAEAHTVTLATPDAPQTFTTQLPLMSTPGSTPYSLTADSFVYRADLSLLPGLKYGVRIGYRSLSRSFSDTLWIDAWRISLPSITLETHPTTRSEVKVQGTKTYKRDSLSR